jgi:hypothetical protein
MADKAVKTPKGPAVYIRLGHLRSAVERVKQAERRGSLTNTLELLISEALEVRKREGRAA